MKKILLAVAAFAALSLGAFAQDTDLESFNEISLTKEGSKIETDLGFAFPMYFGASTLAGATYKGEWAVAEKLIPGFQEMQIPKNFVYGLDMVSLGFKMDDAPVEASLALRWTFMDFTFKNSAYTLREVNHTYIPSAIGLETTSYDGKKSKIHANYLGVPLRVKFKIGEGFVYAGASAELLISGYTKYKKPRVRTTNSGIFSPFRATLEAGFGYEGLGFFVLYGLTPLFPQGLSDARTLSFGLVLGI